MGQQEPGGSHYGDDAQRSPWAAPTPAPPPPDPPAAPWSGVADQPPAPSPAPPRVGRRPALYGSLALLTAAGIAFASFAVFGGSDDVADTESAAPRTDSGATAGVDRPPLPLGSSPVDLASTEPLFTIPAPCMELCAMAASDDRLFVADMTAGGVTAKVMAYDGAGEPAWPDPVMVTAGHPALTVVDDMLLVTGNAWTTTALDVSDGGQRWAADGNAVHLLDDGVLVLHTSGGGNSGSTAVDVRDGRQLWVADGTVSGCGAHVAFSMWFQVTLNDGRTGVQLLSASPGDGNTVVGCGQRGLAVSFGQNEGTAFVSARDGSEVGRLDARFTSTEVAVHGDDLFAAGDRRLTRYRTDGALVEVWSASVEEHVFDVVRAGQIVLVLGAGTQAFSMDGRSLGRLRHDFARARMTDDAFVAVIDDSVQAYDLEHFDLMWSVDVEGVEEVALARDLLFARVDGQILAFG